MTADVLPPIEWPEAHDSAEEARVVETVLDLLTAQTMQRLNTDEVFYLLAPHPARNIEALDEALRELRSGVPGDALWRPLRFGHKNRGWALLLEGREALAALLPAFFRHGAENLLIAAIADKRYLSEADGGIAELAGEIVFGADPDKPLAARYVGLLFDCDRLASVFQGQG